MITLIPQSPFGIGAHRECYLHPEEENKCIKIPFPNNEDKDQLEQYYFERLSRRNISWEMLSRSYGQVSTDRGKGYVFDLIRDFDGTISKSLHYYLSDGGSREISVEDLPSALSRLKEYLLAEKIILANMKPYNLLYKKLEPHEGHLVVIDNIGYHNRHFHLCEYWDWFATVRIKRKWSTFLSELRRNYLDHGPFMRAIATLG